MSFNNLTNNYPGSNMLISQIESTNPCPNQRAISRPLFFVYHYSLFIFGSILNLLAFFILMQGALRCHSTFAYLAFLSLSNGFLSLVRFIQWMLTYYIKTGFENYLFTCRFYHFTLDFLTHFSLFTLVCVNIDRARTVTRNRPNTKFSRSTFHVVLTKEVIIAIILCAYHLHWLVKFGHEVFDDQVRRTICGVDANRTTPSYYHFLEHIYPSIEFFIFFCFPLLINIICTIFIVRSLHLRMRAAKRFSTQNHVPIEPKQSKFCPRIRQIFSCFIPRTTTKSNIYSCFCFQIQCRRHTELRLKIGRSKQSLIRYEEENDSIDRHQISAFTNDLSPDTQQITTNTSAILNKNHRSRRMRDIHLSAMLIVLNILYLIFNLPYHFYQKFGKHIKMNDGDGCITRFTHVIVDILQQAYFSTNFFLYVLTNRRFREEFCNTIMRLCTRGQQYIAEKNLQRRQARSLSFFQSTAIISNFNGEFQAAVLSPEENHESIHDHIELIEASTTQRQTYLIKDQHNNKAVSKLSISIEASNEQI